MAEILDSASLAAAIVQQQVPVILFDTATILDTLRVPFRKGLQTDIISSVATVIDDALARPRRLWLVTTANVIRELKQSQGSVKRELQTHIHEIHLSLGRIMAIARTVAPEHANISFDLLELLLEERISRVLDQLIESTTVFCGTAACVTKARDRLWAGLPPAARAKQEFKDCEIFEEFLELVGSLRKNGFSLPVIFVTSNSNDYGQPPEGFPEIALDLKPLGIRYAAHLSWARTILST